MSALDDAGVTMDDLWETAARIDVALERLTALIEHRPLLVAVADVPGQQASHPSALGKLQQRSPRSPVGDDERAPVVTAPATPVTCDEIDQILADIDRHLAATAERHERLGWRLPPNLSLVKDL